jgi:hypothetical protein
MAKKGKNKKQELSRDQKRRMRLGQILFAMIGVMMILTMLISMIR